MKKVILVLVFLSTFLNAEPFSQKNVSVGILVGSGSLTYQGVFVNRVENYTLFGVSADFFVLDNLSVGVGYIGWFGGDPMINQYTVPVTYYIPASEQFRPYVGAFVRETTYDSELLDNVTSYGGRVGIAYLTSSRSYVAIGWVQDSEDNSHPEFILSFSF